MMKIMSAVLFFVYFYARIYKWKATDRDARPAVGFIRTAAQ